MIPFYYYSGSAKAKSNGSSGSGSATLPSGGTVENEIYKRYSGQLEQKRYYISAQISVHTIRVVHNRTTFANWPHRNL